jgi:hypothetical protein
MTQQCSYTLHTRAIRAYLGLPKNSCSVGVLSEVDWLLPEYRTQLKMIRQYSRILNMDNSRLTKQVYLWDRSLNDSNTISSWSSEVKHVFYSCNLNSTYDANRPFSLQCILKSMKLKLKSEQAEYLKNECEQNPKLRTFLTFKEFNKIPSYVTKPLTFLQKKHLAKIRLGSLEIRIESGRFSRPRLEIYQRLCLVCRDSNVSLGLEPCVETEFHFVFICSKYNTLRNSWLENLVKPENFVNLDEGSKLAIVLNLPENVKSTAQFIISAYNMRSKLLYK